MEHGDLRPSPRDERQFGPASARRSEFAHASLETKPSRLVRPPRVAASPAALECKVLDIIQLKDVEGRILSNFLVLGQVVGVYIDDRYIEGGLVKTAAMNPIAHCGYHDFAAVNEVFSIVRPTAEQNAEARQTG